MEDLLLAQPQEETGPYRRTLVAVGEARPEVVVLGADLGNSTEIDAFQQRFPDRFFNVGSAEQNEVDIAVGMAFEGQVPFVHSFGVFLTRRAYEQVCVQVAMHGANVKLVGMIPGLTSRLGPTHQAIEDLSLMRTLPGMTVLDPADATEIEQAVWAMADHRGPVYARMMRREVRRVLDPERHRFQIGKAVPLAAGRDVLLVSTGLVLETALQAAAMLRSEGVSAAVLHMPTLKPLDRECLLDLARDAGAVVTIENHLVTGGLGSAVAEVLGEALPLPLERVGLRDTFAVPGTPEFLFRRYGITPEAAVSAARRAVTRKSPR
ncbi:MAG TPA: transketolase C-terminal domain-containing protein [Myxococcota bacterium]|nr:transketolase C-terminal domain-containing protein [Myxococcota bacterium]HQK49876.1 transketolase C-terminal domain-containing protein [Myxococcota bacterium]